MKFYLIGIVSLLLISSCKKEAGPGGTSSINGKVYARYYNKNFSILADSAYAPDLDVYIIYGNEQTFGERQRTTYDGSYKFKYLQKGSYKIYTYSKDSTGAYKYYVNQYSPDVVVVKDVKIAKNKQSVEVPDIHIVQ
ncbi:MAG: hypothetical protein H0W84_00750 [Bacteroidetes bacterium]|nr:hypothetical protein [Bacteroidota bacterium]